MTDARTGKSPRSTSGSRAWRSQKGVVMVEYVLLVTFVAIPAVLGITAGAGFLVQSYAAQRTQILQSVP